MMNLTFKVIAFGFGILMAISGVPLMYLIPIYMISMFVILPAIVVAKEIIKPAKN